MLHARQKSGPCEKLEALKPLQDSEDDIKAVAAEALLPVASHVAAMHKRDLKELTTRLWDILLTLEDLDLSTGWTFKSLDHKSKAWIDEARYSAKHDLLYGYSRTAQSAYRSSAAD